MLKVVFCIVLCLYFVSSAVASTGKCAFVTLVAGPEREFVDGAMVLGKSLDKVKNQNIDMILLYRRGLSAFQQELLTNNGRWKIQEISVDIPLPKGYDHKTKRFAYIYDKLIVFSLINYSTVVYLDADALVLENIDELCTNVNAEVAGVSRGPGFNAGIMVVKPSQAMFNAMIKSVGEVPPTYPSYDQGLLNVIYNGLHECPYIDPLEHVDHSAPMAKCARIPARYNADVLIYAVNGNKWPYNPKTGEYTMPKVIHYTFGDIKPWSWYSYMLTPNVKLWWDVKTEAMEYENDYVVSPDALMMAYLLIVSFLFFVAFHKQYSSWLYTIYYDLTYYGNALILAFYFILNVVAGVLAFLLASIFVHSPGINTFLFVALYVNFMRIILFNHVPIPRINLLPYLIFIVAMCVIGVMTNLGEMLRFHERIAILVSCLMLLHWLVGWSMFIKQVLEPIQKKHQEELDESLKII